MENFQIKKGAKFLIGAPASPLPERIVNGLAQSVSEMDAVAFAYLPMMYLPAQMQEPHPVLCLIMNSDFRGSVEPVVESAAQAFTALVPGSYLDILPLGQDNDMVPAIVDTGCCIAVNNQREHNDFIQGQAARSVKKKGFLSGLLKKLSSRAAP